MSTDHPPAAQDPAAARRLRTRSPAVESNGQSVLVELDEPHVTGVIQIERDADPGTVHETLAAVYQTCEDIPGLLAGGEE